MEGVSSRGCFAGRTFATPAGLVYLQRRQPYLDAPTLAFTEDRIDGTTAGICIGRRRQRLEAIAAAISAAKAEIAARRSSSLHHHRLRQSALARCQYLWRPIRRAAGEPTEVLATKAGPGWPAEPTFYIPGEVLEHFREALETGKQRQAERQFRFDAYAAEYPELAAEWQRRFARELPADWDADSPAYATDAMGQATATYPAPSSMHWRPVPELIGGSADLALSTRRSSRVRPHSSPAPTRVAISTSACAMAWEAS